MFGPLGVPEIIFLLVLALLIFGPRKLPEIGRTLGRGMAEFRKASNELRRSLNTDGLQEELRQSDPRRVLREELSRPFTSTEEPKSKGDVPAEVPADTVARTAAGAPDDKTSGEAAGDPVADEAGEPAAGSPVETVESGKTA